jgi:hypothetical protein
MIIRDFFYLTRVVHQPEHGWYTSGFEKDEVKDGIQVRSRHPGYSQSNYFFFPFFYTHLIFFNSHYSSWSPFTQPPVH